MSLLIIFMNLESKTKISLMYVLQNRIEISRVFVFLFAYRECSFLDPFCKCFKSLNMKYAVTTSTTTRITDIMARSCNTTPTVC